MLGPHSVEAKGDCSVVTFDDQKILEAKDSTFTDTGNVGVWTKADSSAAFDELAASRLCTEERRAQ